MSSAIKLGPLTTTFTPPPDCSSVFLYYDSVLGVNGYWGESCVSDDVRAAAETGVYASSCFPEGWAGPFATNYRGHPDEIAIFSPGLHCPRGWTTACSVERSADDDGPTDTQSAMWSVLKDGETGIGCCPTGYSCATLTDLDFQCVKTLSAGESVSGSSISGDECDIQPVTITIEDKFMNKDLYAPQLNLVQGPSRATTTSVTTTSADGGESADAESQGNNGESSGGGLSQSAIIAMGVSIPLFVIAVGIAVFFFWRRKKRTPKPQDAMVPNDPSIKPELAGSWGDSSGSPSAWQKAEMDSGTSVTAVTPFLKDPHLGTSPAHELRGDYMPPELSAAGRVHELDAARRS